MKEQPNLSEEERERRSALRTCIEIETIALCRKLAALLGLTEGQVAYAMLDAVEWCLEPPNSNRYRVTSEVELRFFLTQKARAQC